MATKSMHSLLDELSILLALYKDYIGIQNDAKHFDINRIAESVMANTLTQLGDWGVMKVLEWEKPNHPAIDLISANGEVGIQVTSEKSGEKVAETLKKFNRLSLIPKTLYILMLRDRQKDYKSVDVTAAVKASKIDFCVDDHIVDLQFLRRLAEKKNDPEATEAANTHLKQVFGEWAIDVLARHRSAGKKLLSLFTEYELNATEIFDRLGVQKSLSLASAFETTFLNEHITNDVLRTAADEFQVPYDWLSGTSQILGDIDQSSRWRGFASTFDLIKDTLNRSHNHEATFCIVTPVEVDNFFKLRGNNFCHGKRSEVPILVYSVTKGKYGNVYTHLGIQPGEIEHHRIAAWFLFAFIHKHKVAAPTSYSIHCKWFQWPREKIFETASTLLLVEAKRTVDVRSYQDAYDLTQLGGLDKALFDYDPTLLEKFNNDYAGPLKKKLEKLEFDNLAAFRKYCNSINELIRERLPDELDNGTRIFGEHALRLAEKCNIPLNVLYPDAEAPVSMSFEDAVPEFLLHIQNLSQGQHFKNLGPTIVFYLDVVPA